MNKKKYTIAQILPALNTGGVERGVVEMSVALVENNFNFTTNVWKISFYTFFNVL